MTYSTYVRRTSRQRSLRARSPLFAGSLAIVLVLASASTAQAQATVVPLGTADSYAILAGSEITNTGSTTVTGDIGLHPGTSFSGQGSVTQLDGVTNIDNAQAEVAKNDLVTAYNDAAGQTPPEALSPEVLSEGQTLTPGIYNSASSINLTGTITLDGEGDPDAVFVFQAGSSLITAPNSGINLINGAHACNVFWQVGSSATLDTSTDFHGSILALTSISLNNSATVVGRVLARNGAVTMDTNTITRPDCNDNGDDDVAALTLAKTAADADTPRDAGDVIDYTFTVTNDGNVTITDIEVDDPLIGDVTCALTTLDPGESVECTGSYTVTQDDVDAGEVVNVAHAMGAGPDGEPVTSDEDDETVPMNQVDELTLVKSAINGGELPAVGEDINYTFTVTNTGTTTITDIEVDDPLIGDVTCDPTTLAPGASTTCTGSYTVTEDDVDAGEVVNTARAGGQNPAGGPVESNEASETVPGVPNPSLSIDKVADEPDVAPGVGDVIDYTFTVTNDGNVTITDIEVDDPLIGDVTCELTTLVAGASTTCTGSYVVTQDDVDAGEVVNVARGTGTGPDSQPVVSDEDDEIVSTDSRDELSLVKQSIETADELTAGDVIGYTFEVTNTGTTNMADVTIHDPLIVDVSCPASELAPGQSMTCTGSYTITQADVDAGEVVNTATAVGSPPGDRPQIESPSSTDKATVGPATTPEPEPAKRVQPKPEPSTAGLLPKTGTSVALIALLGTTLLASGALVTFRRRNGSDPT